MIVNYFFYTFCNLYYNYIYIYTNKTIKQMINLTKKNPFKVIEQIELKGGFANFYRIEYQNTKYSCVFNGGQPKLKGKRLTEKEKYFLNEAIEECFLKNL